LTGESRCISYSGSLALRHTLLPVYGELTCDSCKWMATGVPALNDFLRGSSLFALCGVCTVFQTALDQDAFRCKSRALACFTFHGVGCWADDVFSHK
jgi:hypothetical protein